MRFETNEKNIKTDIANCISRCMNATFKSCRSVPPQEPDFIASLVEEIPMDLYNSLRAYAPGYNVAVSGVFCHQKPLANFGIGKKPELGDILLVYIEESKHSNKKCNALLMQAKKIDKPPYVVHSAENHQLQLYEEWPTFKLARAGALNGTEINIEPKTLNAGAQYLLFQSPYKDEKKVCCAYPDKKLVPEKKLSDQIIDLMKFFTGRTFTLEPSEEDGWSNMILDLIRMSEVSTFNRRASGRLNTDRKKSAGDIGILTELNNIIGESTNVVEGAVSCLLICVREDKNQEDYYHQENLFDIDG